RRSRRGAGRPSAPRASRVVSPARARYAEILFGSEPAATAPDLLLVSRAVAQIDSDLPVARGLERGPDGGAEVSLSSDVQLVEVREVVDGGGHVVGPAGRREAAAEGCGDLRLGLMRQLGCDLR